MSFKNERIWIIGASSGIGKSLAQYLHREGANLILSARGEDKLKALNESIGGKHIISPFDVSDYEQVERAVADAMSHTAPLDRIICLAGIYEPAAIKDMDIAMAHKIVMVNLGGMMNMTHAVMPHLRKQGHGQLALCGSVAGFTGLPNGQPYSAAKAGVMNFTQSLRAETDPSIDIKLISPGFVETPMTDKNSFKMPMKITPEEAAENIAKGLLNPAFELHFPKPFTLSVKFLAILPTFIKMKLLRAMYKKQQER